MRLAPLAGLALLLAPTLALAEEAPPREIATGADFMAVCTDAGRALSNPPGDGNRAAARQCKDWMRNFFQIEAARPTVPNDQVMCINGSLKWQEIADEVLGWGKGRSDFDARPADALVRAAMRARHPCPGGN
ncbi:Rap1a/Tai family immunity protein [Zavarzinia sp.]|uniref:Rap1a/Tai family immunity protein n=1 Tax=Zavarzinia sp. TaxID=2027920 RepID=UPI00356A7AE6